MRAESSRFEHSAVAWVSALILLLLLRPAVAEDFPEYCEFTGTAKPVLLAEAATPAQQLKPDEPQTSPEPSTQLSPISPELTRPPQEQELKPLGDVLRALAKPETSRVTLLALAQGQPFSFDRYVVLLGDMRSTLVFIQARELRDRLDKADTIDGETRAWFEPRLRSMETCASARFENRGGNDAFQKSIELVKKWRGELQPLIFETIANPNPISQPSELTTQAPQ